MRIVALLTPVADWSAILEAAGAADTAGLDAGASSRVSGAA
jgi:hypothetical protein